MEEALLNRGSSATEPKLCFILGIMARSGTNYLFRLLDLHPDCAGPGPIWEDCFVRHSELLETFADHDDDALKE